MPDETVRRPMLAVAALGWTIATVILFELALIVIVSLRPGAEFDVVNFAACKTLATSAIIFGMVRVHARDASLRAVLGVKPLGPLEFGLSAAAGAGLYPVLSTIDDMVARRWPHKADEVALLEKMLAVHTTSERLALVIALGVVVPVVDEFFFRGIVFTELRRGGSVFFATIVSSLLFALYPRDLREVPTNFVLALALCRLRAQTGTLVAPVVASVAFWAVDGLPILRGQDPTVDVIYTTPWIVGGGAIAALSLVVVGLGRKTAV